MPRQFAAFEASEDNFISTSARFRRDNPIWINRNFVQGTEPEDAIGRYRSTHFPVLYRASQHAMATMDRAYRDGRGGHLEAT